MGTQGVACSFGRRCWTASGEYGLCGGGFGSSDEAEGRGMMGYEGCRFIDVYVGTPSLLLDGLGPGLH